MCSLRNNLIRLACLPGFRSHIPWRFVSLFFGGFHTKLVDMLMFKVPLRHLESESSAANLVPQIGRARKVVIIIIIIIITAKYLTLLAINVLAENLKSSFSKSLSIPELTQTCASIFLVDPTEPPPKRKTHLSLCKGLHYACLHMCTDFCFTCFAQNSIPSILHLLFKCQVSRAQALNDFMRPIELCSAT